MATAPKCAPWSTLPESLEGRAAARADDALAARQAPVPADLDALAAEYDALVADG
jgi:hypothetical protein